MRPEISKYKIEDLSEGQEFFFEKLIREKDVNGFAELSGDYSPLHMDNQFSFRRGFSGRVVHGALLNSYFSQLIGVHFPGENGLLQIMNIKFLLPVYINDKVKIKAMVDQISLATNSIVLKVSIENTKSGMVCVRGKIQIAFTRMMREKDGS